MARVDQTLMLVEEEVQGTPLELLVRLAGSNANIAEYVDAKTLEEIGIKVVEDYERDKQSQEDWEKRMDDAMKLAMQVAEKKTFPHEHASNVKFPLLTIGAIQFASRALPQVVKKPEPVKGRVNGQFSQEKALKARRQGQHMSYQLLEEIPGWVEGMDSLLHSLPIMGSEIKKTWHDGKTVRSDWVPGKNLCFNYYAKDLESCREKTEIRCVHPQEIKEQQHLGKYMEVDLGPSDQPASDEVSDKIQGVDQPAWEDEGPRDLLEQHRFWDLDGDGYEEPYIMTVDLKTKKPLCIYARFDPDGVVEAPKGVVIKPVEYYTQYKFFPDPSGGIRGIGWGHLLFPINEVVNSAINMLIDAGTDQNTKSGFIAKQLAAKLNGGRAGEIRLPMNTYQIVDSFGDDIAKGIWDRPRSEPSPVLFQLLGLMVEWSQRLTSVTDTMAGENPPTNQPATTTLALLDQGLKVFSGVHWRIHRSLRSELLKIRRLNKIYLPEEVYFRVLDIDPRDVPENAAMVGKMTEAFLVQHGLPPEMAPQIEEYVTQMLAQQMVFRTDYEDDGTDVTPSADPEVKTEQQLLMRLRLLQEAMQAGVRINPTKIAELYAEAGQFSREERRDLVLPPEPPPEDPKVTIEKMRQEGQQAMVQMQGQMNAVLESMRAETAKMKMQLQHYKDMAEFALKVRGQDWKEEKETADLVDNDLDRAADLEKARISARKDAHQQV